MSDAIRSKFIRGYTESWYSSILTTFFCLRRCFNLDNNFEATVTKIDYN